MRLVNLLGASSVQHPEHGTAQAGPDGVFELPEHFGAALAAEAPAQWRTEFDHLAFVARKRLEEWSDPKKAAEVLSWVHGEVQRLTTENVDLKARVAELEGKATEPEPPSDPPKPAAKK